MVFIFYYKPEVFPSVQFNCGMAKVTGVETFLKKSHTNDDFDVAILSLK